MNRKWYSAPYGVWMLIFTIIPFVIMIVYAFTLAGGGFSLDNFARFFDAVYIKVLVRSLGVAALSTALCLLFGYPAALFLSEKGMDSKGIMLVLFVLPMWMNFLLRTYAWLSLLESNGPITMAVNAVIRFFGGEEIRLLYNYNAVVMGMIYNFLPFMILPIYSVLRKIDRRLIEAAQDLGANGLHVFLKVILPLSVPGIVSGVIMVFMPAVTTFVISSLLGGGIKLFGDLIQNQMLITGDWNFGSALSLILMIIMLLSMALISVIDKDEGGGTLL